MRNTVSHQIKIITGKIAAVLAGSVMALSVNGIVAGATEGEGLGMSMPVEAATDLTQYAEPETASAEPVQQPVQETAQEEEAAIKYVQNNEVKGSGRNIKTNLNGHYYASGVKGIAMTDQEWSLQVEAGMGVVEYFWVNTWDITQDTAPMAVETFRIVAASEGAELGPVVQINIHKTLNGKMTSLEGNAVRFTTVMGIPDDFERAGDGYAVVLVKAGGSFEILSDMDEDDKTVTFKAKAGDGAYALIHY